MANADDIQKLDQPELRCAGSQIPGQPFVVDPVVRADVNGDGAQDTLAIVFCNGNGAQPSGAVLYLAGKDGTGVRRASLLTWNGAVNAPIPQRIGFDDRIVIDSTGCSTVDKCGAGADLRFTDYFRVAS